MQTKQIGHPLQTQRDHMLVIYHIPKKSSSPRLSYVHPRVWKPTRPPRKKTPVAAPPLVGLQPSRGSEKEEVILSPGPRTQLGLKPQEGPPRKKDTKKCGFHKYEHQKK